MIKTNKWTENEVHYHASGIIFDMELEMLSCNSQKRNFRHKILVEIPERCSFRDHFIWDFVPTGKLYIQTKKNSRY